MNVRRTLVGLLLAPMAFVTTLASAEPSLQSPEPLLWSTDHTVAWQLYPDRTDRQLYYRLPYLFTLEADGSGQPMIFSRRDETGQLVVTFYWGAQSDAGREEAFASAFKGKYGDNTRFAEPVPETMVAEAPPEIADQFGGAITFGSLDPVPGSVMTGEIRIPKESERDFLRAATGIGFTGLVTLNYYFDTPDRGTVRLAYSTALLMRVPQVCMLRPEHPCSW